VGKNIAEIKMEDLNKNKDSIHIPFLKLNGKNLTTFQEDIKKFIASFNDPVIGNRDASHVSLNTLLSPQEKVSMITMKILDLIKKLQQGNA
jgi:hypothetical protein